MWIIEFRFVIQMVALSGIDLNLCDSHNRRAKMVAFTKYYDTVLQLGTAIHNLTAAGHVVRTVIHTDAPTVATDDELADLTQITGTGYTAGGIDIQNGYTGSGGVATMTGVDTTWTAGAADWSASARYVSMHNDNSTTDKLLGGWDYGATFGLGNGETFTVDFGASVATLT